MVPVFIGSAERGNGVTRLLKALRHEAPTLAETRARLGVAEDGPPLAQIVKTLHMGQGGKLSMGRVLRGVFHEGDTVIGSRGAEATHRLAADAISGAARRACRKQRPARRSGSAGSKVWQPAIVSPPARPARTPFCRMRRPSRSTRCRLRIKDRKDDVRLSGALAKISEEDPSLVVETSPELGEIRLLGQGEMHLRVAVERSAIALPGRRRDHRSRASAIARRSASRHRPVADIASRRAVMGSSAT